jgi:hypothetical protein
MSEQDENFSQSVGSHYISVDWGDYFELGISPIQSMLDFSNPPREISHLDNYLEQAYSQQAPPAPSITFSSDPRENDTFRFSSLREFYGDTIEEEEEEEYDDEQEYYAEMQEIENEDIISRHHEEMINHFLSVEFVIHLITN